MSPVSTNRSNDIDADQGLTQGEIHIAASKEGEIMSTPAVVERSGSSGLGDVVELILDKGLVIDAFVQVSLIGIEVLTIQARVVMASVETYLRYAQAIERLDIRGEEISVDVRHGALPLGPTAQKETQVVVKGVTVETDGEKS
ncbi:gas vesicle protein [Nonomuraea sp. NBC_00507]|uniref:gas vesicle protein GvpJ n=1 Tax=Nonomuraea sp. NBC_00507 TaxID=2976002 RepID=UPI002E1818F5